MTTNHSEFTPQTMTEAEVLATPEFIQASDILQHRSLKPSHVMEISLPRNKWSIEAIGTLLRCLTPSTKGCGYSFETYGGDDNEYIFFKNTRTESDSELNLANLTPEVFKAYAAQVFGTYSDEELEKEFRDYKQMLSEVGQVRDAKGKALVVQTEALVEAIVAVAYLRGLPWAVMEMHKTVPPSQA